MSKPYNFATKFPETAHYQGSELRSGNSVCLRPHYYDSEDLMQKLSYGIFCRDSYFPTDVKINNYDGVPHCIGQIKRWDNDDQYQLCHEALAWLDFRVDEIAEFCFNAQQMSVKQGIKKYGEKGKESVMK